MATQSATKSEHLQIRLTAKQKSALRRSARSAGMGMSEFVLSRLVPAAGVRFRELVRATGDGDRRRFAFAELSDLLARLARAEFLDAVADPPPTALSLYLQNYVAAMVEHAAYQKGVDPPAWVAEIEPLNRPYFATPLAGLRLHLLAASPVPFRRRNLFVDSAVGDRV